MRANSKNLFGSAPQVAMLQRGADLHQLVGSHPQFTYYGRVVGLTSPDDASFDTFTALVRLQGNSSYADLSDEDVPNMASALETQGLQPLQYARWDSQSKSLAIADRVMTTNPIPPSYQLNWLSPQTDINTRTSLAETCAACGVLPPSLAVLSGDAQPGVCPFLLDQSGRVIALAGSAAYLSAAHPAHMQSCWWGMLAVHPAHRGMELSLLLGALAMTEMRDRFGFSQFFTGVVPGNVPSEKICAKMGLHHTGRSILAAADPDLLPGGRMTK